MTGDIPGGHGMRIGEMYMLENNEGRTGRFIIQELAQPYTGTPEFQEIYRKFAKRILWIDDEVCPGAFQM